MSSSNDGVFLRRPLWVLLGTLGTAPRSTSTSLSCSGATTSLVGVIKESRVGCDDDGWMVRPNKEQGYPHFFHIFSHTEVTSVLIKGNLDVRYIGFGDQSKK